ncbi:MAG TPA: hypothetical protein VET89_06770 [Stellaceae bacterium]|nr:hypothetical protein [Stellaceae bacterium]
MPDAAARSAGGCEDDAPIDAALADKVRFLSDPSSYPDSHPGDEGRVEVMETHFSWVFLTGSHAFKLKKPACGAGFDFRSIQARRRNAVAEIRLNRRLAPKVYLGIVALTRNPSGRLQLGGDGAPVDWLVKMVRLEAGHMLDQRFAGGHWHYAELEAVAYRLASFFASARRAALAPPAQIVQVRGELRRARAAFVEVAEPALWCLAAPVLRNLDAFMVRRSRLLRRRVEDRRLVDGHGDLRPEHVYLKGVPQIIDCLEFRSDLRRLDPVCEIAFLALECSRLGASPLKSRLIRRYRRRTGDMPPAVLVAFYTALNAVVRARLAVEHIAEPGTRTREDWIDRAASYLAIAASQHQQLSR